MRTLALLFAILSSGCGLIPKPHKSQPSQITGTELEQKYAKYLKLVSSAKDTHGFLEPKCDSLLYTSLAAYGGAALDPMLAEKNPGEWHRHPSFDCYPDHSASTISRDMFLGLFYYLYKTKNRDAMLRIKEFGVNNNWFMGVAKDPVIAVSRTLMTYPMITLLYDMAKIPEDPPIPEIDGVEGTSEEDSWITQPNFRGHLDVLRIMLQGMVRGGISEFSLQLLRQYHLENPKNSLYCAAYRKFVDGQMDDCVATLLDASIFPEDSLPTSSNYCVRYLWQGMDTEHDITPCPEQGKKHSGSDFVFAASVILNK